MAEIITGEFSKYRSNLIDYHQSLKIPAWDCGPEKPIRPAKPVPSKAPHGSIEADIAAIELRSAVENYEKTLTAYLASVRDYESWHQRHSGPVILEFWSCDWADAQRHDTRAVAEGRQHRRRYYRYDPRAARLGLPVGVEPGRSHAEQIERQAAADAALQVAKSQDPEFG